MYGKVYSIISGIYHIKIDNGQIIKIPGAGKLRFQNIMPLVGDYVEVFNDQLEKVLERKNSFVRPKVANVDQVIVVMSLKEPEFQSFLLDKYLAIIEAKNIHPVLFFTKSDLCEDFFFFDEYKKMHYQVFLIDNIDLNYKNKVKEIFRNKTNVFLGQTGVGKTTTINYLSDNDYQTQEISKALGRGKHTTRVLRIVEFNGGELIDTPGFSSLNLDLDPLELAHSYKNFNELSKFCKFRSCLHLNENLKDCAVKQQIDISIPEWRYINYVKLQKETKKEKY